MDVHAEYIDLCVHMYILNLSTRDSDDGQQLKSRPLDLRPLDQDERSLLCVGLVRVGQLLRAST